MKRNTMLLLLALLSTVLMSLPFLMKGLGWMALVGLVPLLCMERVADRTGMKHFWWWHYGTFVLWNAATTWWIGNATVGGGIFAVLANALQMSVVFGLFRWVKRRMGGAVPYIFLAAAWMAWERYYLTVAQISWPWLVLGNSFAGTVGLVQWYEYTGTLGGSLWVWVSNLAVFGFLVALSDGRWSRWNGKARSAAVTGIVAVVFGPMLWSALLWHWYDETNDPLQVVIAQPNLDPYHKFGGLPQDQQTAIVLDQFEKGVKGLERPALLLAPETFTGDIVLNDVPQSKTFRRFRDFTAAHPGTEILFGASTWEYIYQDGRPSATARRMGDHAWYESHNSALLVDSTGRYDLFHKSKLVPGVEMTPYPAVIGRIDDALLGGVAGRCIGQKDIDVLHFRADARDIPVGCAVCYESVFGEYCTGYVRKGAQLIAVITNDAWWGNTPGYRQHLEYSSLRAIETRRDIARCANTGISALIDQCGRIVARTSWWEPAVLTGTVRLNTYETFFVRYGDIVGRLAVFVFSLVLLAALVVPRKSA
ncbi:MAG: apolipoprotein N-acyltransferase [Bacteroidales bacterium]|nr:apolipoprotein N-acyltransferase [Bacteroidales bacterium]